MAPKLAIGATAVAGVAVLAWAGHAWLQHLHEVRLATAASSPMLACTEGNGLPPGFPAVRHAGMVHVAGGSFTPGTLAGYPDERPNGSATLRAFWIDRTEVTNAQFAQFVAATGYVTEAEREGGAAVFRAPPPKAPAGTPWWHYVAGANWQQPEGPNSHVADRQHHPVVHVTLADARAYAQWLGRSLPTEAEWEWAARGQGQPEGVNDEPRNPDGRPEANYWQGVFPAVNAADDGYAERAPVGCFPANSWGLHDMIGNVWEWTEDTYTGARQAHGHGRPYDEWQGLQRSTTAPVHVIKGGSYLCADNYCSRYRSTSRHPHEVDLGTSHIGFRTVLRAH